MPEVPYGHKTQRPSPVSDIHILWMTSGLGCDGDSVSITAATQPSIEDVLLGAIPGLPKVHLHNPVLAYEVGDDFMKYWYQAADGKLNPFVLVVEGSIPNEKIKKEGYWAALGTDSKTGQPITTNEWIDRLAPKALAVVAIGTCATYGGIHAMSGNPTGAWVWRTTWAGIGKSVAGLAHRECPRLPGSARQLHGDAALPSVSGGGTCAHDSSRRSAAADVALRQDGARRLRPRGLLRAGRLCRGLRLAEVHREAGMLGAGGELQRAEARLDGRNRRLPERRRNLHRLHHARLPRQVHAVHGRAAGVALCRRAASGFMGARSARCARSRMTRSTRNRSGAIRAPNSRRAITRRLH